MATKLSPKMLDALAFVLPVRADNIDECDREPYRWVRMETRPTVEALVRRGLVEHCYGDWPDGYKGRLTDEGLAARNEVRSARQERNRAIARLMRG